MGGGASSGAGHDIFVGGGVMGARMRDHDWSGSPLGCPDTWPQSLRSVVGLLLGSKFPMFVAWGPELGFLYNDPYAEILGGKHPAALGRRFREIWSEIWDDINPLIEAALAGQASYRENLPLLMNRTGKAEQTYFTFSYSPVRDESGTVAGMYCACTETTAQVVAQRRLVAERERLTQLFRQAPGFMAMLGGPDHVFELVNPAYSQLIGHRDVLGLPARKALPEIEGQGFFELLDTVYASGQAFRGEAMRVGLQRSPGAPVEERFVDLVYQPVTDASGGVTGIFAEGYDVTDRVLAEAALRESEDHYRHAAELNPQVAWTATPDGQLDRVAERWREWTGTSGLGESWGEGLHPDDLGFTVEAWRRSVATGLPYDVEHRVKLRSGEFRWARSRAFPRLDRGGRTVKWYGATEDIHDQKLAEARLRDSEQRFQAIANSIDQMVWSTRPDGYHDFYNQRWYDYTGVPQGSTDGEAWNGMFHPDDQDRAWATWRRSLETGEPYHIEYRLRHRSGAYRWVLGRAQPVRGEDGGIVRWFGTCTDIQEIVDAREVLARSREALEAEVQQRTRERDLFAKLVETTDTFIQVADLGYRWLAINKASADEFERIFGVRPKVGDGMLDLLADLPEQRAAVRDIWSRALGGQAFTEIGEFGDPARDRRSYEMKFTPLFGPDGERIGAYQFVYDVTDRLESQARLAEAEAQLRQAQKMEAVGQLTGGIAHDFNNLLAGIVGSLDLMQTRIAQGRSDAIERYAKAAMSSAQRAAALTHRLLAFSRRQPLDPKPVNANALVAGMEDLLRRTIGPLHALELVTAGGLWTTLCDPNQLESAILNLAINARDAMPDGGKLTIETCNAHLDDAYAAGSRDVTPGQYVCICVTDTGSGMSDEVASRAFEPFFTTKPLGQGTGLGLSMVYGFAKQSEGHLKIYSEEGKGTTVKIYLPRHWGPAEEEEGPGGSLEAARAEDGETVLVVEDEPVIRDLIVEVLGELGYRALEAADGPTGLKILQSRERIDLVVTDVGLPGLNGRQLADEARGRRPGLKVLFITGYAENATLANGFLEPGMEMLTKPFAVEALAAKIRSMIRNG